MMESELFERKHAVQIIGQMDLNRLVTYIKNRLTEKSIIPPIDMRSEEALESFLEEVYENSSDDEFKSRFRHAISILISEEQLNISSVDYLAILLSLCEELLISEATVPISGLVLSENLKGIDSMYGDLHHRALMALARLPQGIKMTDIWVNSIKDQKYTAAAFAALRSQGLETICRYLSQFVRMYQKNPESIDLNIGIDTLYEDFKDTYQESEITSRLTQCFEHEDPLIIDTMKNTIESTGRTFPISSLPIPTNITEMDRIIDELMEKGKNDQNLALSFFSYLMGAGVKDAQYYFNKIISSPGDYRWGTLNLALLYLEKKDVGMAHYFLKKSAGVLSNLERIEDVLPTITQHERIRQLKSSLCQLLTHKYSFEIDYEIKAWISIAKIEKRADRVEKWSILENDLKNGLLVET
jgi:hypothetical protein